MQPLAAQRLYRPPRSEKVTQQRAAQRGSDTDQTEGFEKRQRTASVGTIRCRHGLKRKN